MTRCLRVVLSSMMCLSLISPAIASEFNQQPAATESSFSKYIKKTPYQNIYQSNNSEFALIESDTIQEVDMTEYTISDADEVELLLKNDNIPQEVRNAIEKEFRAIQGRADEDASITLISPKAISSVASGDAMQPPAKLFASTTYNGVKMQSWRLVSSKKNTPSREIKDGTNTYSWASNTTNIALALAGMGASGGTASAVLGLRSLGKSIIDIAVWEGDANLIKGHSKDYAELKLIYYSTEQWTYSWINNDWVLSLGTQQVEVTRTITTMNYYIPAKDDWVMGTATNNVSTTFKSHDFDTQWKKAYECGAYTETQWLVGKYNGNTFDFTE